jgi:hypothetical protein
MDNGVIAWGLEDEYLYTELPPPTLNDPCYWGAHPSDELEYDCFIRQALTRATREIAARSWGGSSHDAPAWLGEDLVLITNGIVDWTNTSEASSVLLNHLPGGWIDPDCLRVGGVSRVLDGTRILLAEVPGEINLEWREFSFITLDAPTWTEDPDRRAETLYHQLIRPLVELQDTKDDTLSGWLEYMFGCCEGKHVAYYSRYVPSALIHAIARAHGVHLIHIPLSRLPTAILTRNQGYQSMHLSLSQWQESGRRLEQVHRYNEAALVREHCGSR